MANSNEYKLINGIFTEEDAQDLLTHFFSEKIKLHALRQFSLYERYGIKCEYSEKRTKELKADKAEILDLLKEARLTGKSLRINSDIQIELVDKEPTLKDGKLLDMSMC